MGLEIQVVVLAIFAALLSSSKSFWLKTGHDRFLMLSLNNLFCIFLALILIPFVPLPNKEAFPFLILSSIIYTLSVYCQVGSYKLTELSLLEPIKNAIRLITICIFSVVLVGDTFEMKHLAAISIIVIALTMLIEWSVFKSGKRGILYSFLLGVVGGSHAISDLIGIRVSGNPASYIVWNLLIGIPVVIIGLSRHFGSIKTFLNMHWQKTVYLSLSDVLSYGAFLLILYVYNVPSALPLLNLGIVVSVFLAVVFLKEKVSFRRWVAAFLVVGSVSLVQAF